MARPKTKKDGRGIRLYLTQTAITLGQNKADAGDVSLSTLVENLLRQHGAIKRGILRDRLRKEFL